MCVCTFIYIYIYIIVMYRERGRYYVCSHGLRRPRLLTLDPTLGPPPYTPLGAFVAPLLCCSSEVALSLCRSPTLSPFPTALLPLPYPFPASSLPLPCLFPAPLLCCSVAARAAVAQGAARQEAADGKQNRWAGDIYMYVHVCTHIYIYIYIIERYMYRERERCVYIIYIYI